MKEICRWSLDWTELMNHLRDEERYHFNPDKLKVSVISLERKSRVALTLKSLAKQKIPHEVFPAVDGLTGFEIGVLQTYAGKKRLKRLQRLSQKSYEEAKNLYSKVDQLSDKGLRDSIHEALRFGCLLSHAFLWQKMLAAQIPATVILEDDVLIAEDFSDRLIVLLQSLPTSWDLLYLNGCFIKFGQRFAPGLRLSRGGLCTFGYVISLSGANKLLVALEGSDVPIDHILDQEVLTGRVIAFHADPALVEVMPFLESTLAY
ncbi:glycosyltransferase family 25 protein [bacterium]|nr:glycosyltransferase family 25 protein [bacterium]